MPLFGSFSLLFALALTAYCFFAGALALRGAAVGHNTDRLSDTARRAGIATWVAVAGAAVALVTSALNNDFSVAYILHHTNRALPTPHKLAVFPSPDEGSQ